MLKNLFLPVLMIIVLPAISQEKAYNNILFVNSRMDGNYFYSKTSCTSPSWIKNIRNKLPVNKDIFFTPGNSLQLNFVNGKTGTWSAEINKPEWRGQDKIKEGELLSFAVNISAGTNISELPAIQIRLSDSSTSSTLSLDRYIVVIQQGKWKKVLIPLRDFTKIKFKSAGDIKAIIFSQKSTDGKEHVINIDDMEIRSSVMPALQSAAIAIEKAKGYAKHVDIEWKPFIDTTVQYIKIYRSVDEKNFAPVGVQIPSISRYTDYTGETGKNFIIEFL